MRQEVASSATSLPVLIRTMAEHDPDRIYIDDLDGSPLSYADVHRGALRWANALQRAGITEGENVAVILPTRPETVLVWLGMAWLHAVEVPLNTSYTGRVLADTLNRSDARYLVTARRYLPRLQDIADSLTTLKTVIVVDDGAETTSLPTVDRSALFAEPSEADSFKPPAPHVTATIIYTSGTTGLSKGVMVPWGHLYATALGGWPSWDIDEDDRFYSPLPLFHSSAKNALYMMAVVGGRVVMRNRFRTDQFLDDIRRSGATTTLLLGAMVTFLQKQPPNPADAETPLRNVLMAPLVPDAAEFCERFGVRICTGYSMTEISSPIASMGWNSEVLESCGVLRPGYDARIVDEWDNPLPDGEHGELIVRSDHPWTLMSGYWGMPAETAAAWRNGWFHTGDILRRDSEGRFYFIDRKKDAIRRRGENISSYEVEREILDHRAVFECAVVGVSSEWGENEVLACIVPRPGQSIEPAELVEFLIPRLPHFMVPRYVEILDELPKTPTQKIQKGLLRERGLSASTWDRESAGITVTRRE
jgi:carnitine-CoA ligase